MRTLLGRGSTAQPKLSPDAAGIPPADSSLDRQRLVCSPLIVFSCFVKSCIDPGFKNSTHVLGPVQSSVSAHLQAIEGERLGGVCVVFPSRQNTPCKAVPSVWVSREGAPRSMPLSLVPGADHTGFANLQEQGQ